MIFQRQTGTTIQAAFAKFHKDNPRVYQMFTEQVLRAVRRKRLRVSSKAIINWIRWEVSLDIKSTDGYKVNDAFTAHYARQFIKDYPEYTDMFEFRELRDGSEEKKPVSTDPFETEVLNALSAGGRITHYTDAQAVSLISGKPPKATKLTMLFFQKLKDKKLIKLASTDMFCEVYSSTGGRTVKRKPIGRKASGKKPITSKPVARKKKIMRNHE